MAANDSVEEQRWEARLKEIEGDDGVQWRDYRARRLLAVTGPDAPAALAEVNRLAIYEQSHRPAWSAVQLLNGMLAERQGAAADAISDYQQAIALGERRLAVYERLITLLYQQERFHEAWKTLSQFQHFLGQSQDLLSLAISVSLRQDAVQQAVGLATSAVEQRPGDSIAWIWLGQTQLLAGHPAEAVQACKKATELGRRTCELGTPYS